MGREKLVSYLMNQNHPRGRSKAVFLKSLGFDASNVEALAEALLTHRHLDPTRISTNMWGTRYVVEGPVTAPDGRSAEMRTIRQTASPADLVAQLVTAYPLK